MTFGALLERWFEMRSPDWSPKTVLEHRRFIDRLVGPALGSITLRKLRSEDLDGLRPPAQERRSYSRLEHGVLVRLGGLAAEGLTRQGSEAGSVERVASINGRAAARVDWCHEPSTRSTVTRPRRYDGMTDSPSDLELSDERAVGRHQDPSPGMPRWVKVTLIIALALVLLFVMAKVTGIGGQHGPGRHGSSDGSPSANVEREGGHKPPGDHKP